jgi:hypothetical protein
MRIGLSSEWPASAVVVEGDGLDRAAAPGGATGRAGPEPYPPAGSRQPISSGFVFVAGV